MKKYLLTLALAISVLAIFSGDAPPAKPFPVAVVTANVAYGAELSKLQHDYAQHVADANKKYVDALDVAMKDAMKAGDLQTANAIQGLKDEVQSDLVRDQTPPKVIGDRLYLADMEEDDGSAATWNLGKKGRIGGNKITVDKRYSPNGLGMHPFGQGGESHVSYKLNGQYKTFKSGVAINDSSGGAGSPLTFKVYGDDMLLWKSKHIQKHGETDVCSVNITGVRSLKLVVECPADATGAHAVWIEPQVAK